MVEVVSLNMMVQEKYFVTVFLMNGFQLKGNIVSFDDNAIILSSQGVQRMIYKHAISTIEF